MAITLPLNTISLSSIATKLANDKNCTHPAGHCFASDGGTGIPSNLKVAVNRGKVGEVWELDSKQDEVIKKTNYIQCQYCLKYKLIDKQPEGDYEPKQ